MADTKTLQETWVKELLQEPLLARLATCNPATMQPHVVPIWYEWDGQWVNVSTFRSTRKVRELQKNPKVSLVVDKDTSGGGSRAVILEGEAELVYDHDQARQIGESIYKRYLGEAGAMAAEPQSWLDDEQHMIVRFKPSKVMVWKG